MFKITAWIGPLLIILALYSCSTNSSPSFSETPKSVDTVPTTDKTAAGWEAEWGRILKEGNKESKIIVYGPPIPEVRKNFTESFQKATNNKEGS